MVENQEERLSRIQITEEWKPEDEDMALQRAIFFCHSLNGHLRQNLLKLIDKCDAEDFGEKISAEVEESSFDEAVKEITSTYLHLVGLDQGGAKAPIWLIKFLFECQQEADSICPEPPAVEVIEKRGTMPAPEMLADLEESVSSLFGLRTYPRARKWMQEFFKFNQHFSNELLALCLSQPTEVLNKHLQIYTE